MVGHEPASRWRRSRGSRSTLRCSSRSIGSPWRSRCSASTPTRSWSLVPTSHSVAKPSTGREPPRSASRSPGWSAVVASQLDPAAGLRLDAIGFGFALGAAVSQAVFVVVSRSGYPSVPGGPGDGRRPCSHRGVFMCRSCLDGHHGTAGLPAEHAVDLAADRLHRIVRRGDPVDPVPDRHPRRSAARGPASSCCSSRWSAWSSPRGCSTRV